MIIVVDNENVVKAILHSDMSTDDKIGALVLLSQKKQDDKESNRRARQAVIEVMNGAMGEPMRAKDIHTCLPENDYGTVLGALRTLTNNGVLKAQKIEDGTVTIIVQEWQRTPEEGRYSGHYVGVEKEVPNKYNLYTLNF